MQFVNFRETDKICSVKFQSSLSSQLADLHFLVDFIQPFQLFFEKSVATSPVMLNYEPNFCLVRFHKWQNQEQLVMPTSKTDQTSNQFKNFRKCTLQSLKHKPPITFTSTWNYSSRNQPKRHTPLASTKQYLVIWQVTIKLEQRFTKNDFCVNNHPHPPHLVFSLVK